ncbi:RNA-binding NOB1-like protein [Juglans microcarpa x Juglans regia]|uniref:RNA-binding NOB1-like protein n=1 Tax=Juglans microcarpa x Juglans regia TaxID=2249226 RepID=UPI001B7DDA73|nr:RNA-binding NOB1-like protein [Juglans microcarpa x Juglans regia]
MEDAAPAPCWSNILKRPPPPKPINQDPIPANGVFVESCKSARGIAVAVVDANAMISGGDKLTHCADKFITVPEVMAEVRDPSSRHRLSFLPFSLHSMDPTPDSLNKVIKFAKATGDLQTLSDVDLKLIALTYTLEAQIHGNKNIRDCPPPIHLVNVKTLHEKDMPGWGSNVPNLEEWEALEHEVGDGSNPSNSRILPLQDLNLNIVDAVDDDDHKSEDGSKSSSLNQEGVVEGGRRRYLPKKKEVNIEGKKMVADGIDASQGEFDDNADDWRPAVSRSTRRRYLRRKSRLEYYSSLAEKDAEKDEVENVVVEDTRGLEKGVSEGSEIKEGENVGDENLSMVLERMRLEEDSMKGLQEGKELEHSESKGLWSNDPELAVSNEALVVDGDEIDMGDEGLGPEEMSSQDNESVDASNIDDDSEQSWMLRSLSESSVACVTSDFAMQNVLLQMGLRLLAPGGMQIHQLHRWVLKCHACYTVTTEVGRIFCPKCGNGGTLRKVAVTVGENGVVLAARRPRITLRGTKFSLPLPQGGRDAIAKNLVLREDQLPQKLLYPKTKKKINKQGDDFFTMDDFGDHSDKRAQLQPPVRKALAVFSGKRNPNDNHYSRSKHK